MENPLLAKFFTNNFTVLPLSYILVIEVHIGITSEVLRMCYSDGI